MWWSILFILILGRIFVKWTFEKCQSKVCLVGKTAIVTGGSKGIGYATVVDFASRGCKVVVASRSNPEREISNMIKITHNPQIRWKHLDLMSLESIRKFSKEIHEEEDKIDLLINNAGIAIAESTKYTKDGLHPLMQTNLFGSFLLTHLLVDLLKKPGHARIIFVSSVMSFCHSLSLNNLNYPENEPDVFSVNVRIYGNSKVGQILVSNEFAERLKPFGITSNALHPGVVKTDIYRDIFKHNFYEAFTAVFYNLFLRYFGRTVEEGAQRTIEMAISDEYKNVSATFWFASSWIPRPRKTKNKQFQKSVWSAIENFVQLKPHEKI